MTLLSARRLLKMLQAACAPTLCLISLLMVVAVHSSAPAPTAASILHSLADLNAAIVGSPLLLVVFDQFSPSSSGGGSASPVTECSTACQKLLMLCEGAAALPLPQRSRITCGRAQGEREWMKVCVLFLHLIKFHAVAVTRANCQILPTSHSINASSVSSSFCRNVKECVSCSRRAFTHQCLRHRQLLSVRARGAD